MQVITREPRLLLRGHPTPDVAAAFAEDVRTGLRASPKALACRYFYDAEGSRLFERICELPEYYLTRAEASILEAKAGDLAASFDVEPELVELGSGSAQKTRYLLDACVSAHGRVAYHPIDVSVAALRASAAGLLEDYPTLEIEAYAADYVEGLHALRDGDGADKPRLVLWLGSSIGNLHRAEAAAFLASVRAELGPRDRILVGIDLRKDRAVLEAAYDDAQGVTARFNKNVLARINRELGGGFDLERFAHRATYDAEVGRVEMYLDSLEAQRVPVAALDLEVEFAAGEPLHTENSYKYDQREIERLLADAGLRPVEQWYDGERRFTLVLGAPAEA